MFNKTEEEERRYLEKILFKLNKRLFAMETKISSAYNDVIEAKKYIWENNLDTAERAFSRMDVALEIDSSEKTMEQRKKGRKLLQSPYFGRVDFIEKGEKQTESFYIGVHSFYDEDSLENLIYDWRAPVSSLFYDYGIGNAHFLTPAGNVEGEVTLKRQYKIKNGVMEYMIESSLNINDDILQKELSSTSDEKMKNIVASIQKEQNAIIRNETSKEVIIQGVAGSGKTSVAMHRIAFLLYRYKDTLTSKDILIISPNKVFSDYISNVLPELGEENTLETSMEELARKELAGIRDIQSFDQQVIELIDSSDEQVIERIKYKATIDFLHEFDRFIDFMDTEYFSPVDITIDFLSISKEELLKRYNALKQMPIKPRLEKIATNIVSGSRDEDGKKLTAQAARKTKAAIKKMFQFQDVLSLYKDFYRFIGKEYLFTYKKGDTLEYADLFPVIYLKSYFEEITHYNHVKHLLVDEMQDYTPIQYAVLSKLFPCRKTILGDSSQSVNPYSSTSITDIKKVFPNADTVELVKSYRSTLEITNFTKQLNVNKKLTPIERHGEEPEIKKCKNTRHELEEIKEMVDGFLKSELDSLGIICKTQVQAEEVYQVMKHLNEDVYLLSFDSEEYHEGIIITSAHMAKGLEFDQVIVPFVDAFTYQTDLDKSLLYIACTRAMHKLDLLYSGKKTLFLEGNSK